MADFSIVVVIISLMPLNSTWDSVVGHMVGRRGHNEIIESHVGPFHQRSPNLLIGSLDFLCLLDSVSLERTLTL